MRKKHPDVLGLMFHEDTISGMQAHIENMFDDYRRAIAIHLTNDEIFNLVTPQEYRAETMRVAGRINPQYLNNVSTFKAIIVCDIEEKVKFNLSYPYTILVPKDICIEWTQENAELIRSINLWATRRREIGIEYGRARALIPWLCRNHSVRQVLYLLPAIKKLVREAHADIYDQLLELKPQPTDTVYPLRVMIGQVVDTLTEAVLLPKVEEGKRVSIELQETEFMVDCEFQSILSFKSL